MIRSENKTARNRRFRDEGFPDGTTEARSYDLRDRIAEIKTSKAGADLALFQYQYDAAGQIIGETAVVAGQTRTSSYQYDALSRLTRAQIVEGGNTTTLSWTFDAVGNRLSQTMSTEPSTSLGRSGAKGATITTTYVYDANDRLLSETTDETPVRTVAYSYDESGNLLRRVESTGLAPSPSIIDDTRFQWNAEDRLIAVTEDAHTASPQVTQYQYNGLDERIAEVLPGSGSLQDRTRIFNFDHSLAHSQVIEERNGTGYLSAYHTVMPFANAQGARRLSELRGTPQSNASDLPANPVWHRYVSDHQSTTRALVDATGSLTDTFGYLPYGEVNQRTGNTQTAFQYTGEPLAAGGLTYLRARFVDPRQGRFLGMDPYIGCRKCPQTLHRFAYSADNPVRFVDPSGEVFTLSGLLAAQNQIATLRSVSAREAFRQGGKQAGFKVLKEVGKLAEDAVLDMIKDCLGLDKLQRGRNKLGPNKRVNLDGGILLADGLVDLEVKSGLPAIGGARHEKTG